MNADELAEIGRVGTRCYIQLELPFQKQSTGLETVVDPPLWDPSPETLERLHREGIEQRRALEPAFRRSLNPPGYWERRIYK